MNPHADTSGDTPCSYTLRDTQDADEHAACLTNWTQRYDQLSAGPFAGEFEEFCFGKVQLFREKLNQTVHQSGTAWPGSRTVAVPVRIEGAGWYNGEPYDANSVLTLGGSEELDFRTPRQLEILACTADSAALNAHALQVEHRNFEAELAGRQLTQVAPAKLQALGALLSTMMSSLRAAPALLQHVHTRRAMEQAMFSALLDTVHVQEPAARPSTRTRQYVVSRAREYMQAHIDEPITVADLCIELGVSRRTLQYSFQDVLDLNPVKFLRTLRLNAARRALKRAAASGQGSVTDVAGEWGFWHLSHFSADYKAMFGELPSETLRRGA